MAHGFQYIPRTNEPPKIEPPKAETIAMWLRHKQGCTCDACLANLSFLDRMAEDFNKYAWKQFEHRARIANRLNELS